MAFQEASEPKRVTVNWTGSNWTGSNCNRPNWMLQWNRWNQNWTEREPSEPDFGVYIGTNKLEFGLEDINKYFESSYGGRFAQGIRWC